MCSNCPPVTAGKESGNKIVHYQPDCLNWSCPECRPKREAMWIEQMTMNWSGFSTIYFDVIDAKDWMAYRKRVVRGGGRYARIIGLDDTFYVFSDIQVNNSRSLSLDTAIQKFEWCVKQAPSPLCRKDGHVISTSRAWKLLKAIKLFDDFELIAIGVGKQEVKRILDELDQRHETKPFNQYMQYDVLVSVLASGEVYRTFKAKMRTAKRVEKPSPHLNTRENFRFQEHRDSDLYTGDKRRSKDAFDRLRFAHAPVEF